MKRIIASVALIAAQTGTAFAEDPSLFVHGGISAIIATKDTFSIEVFDQVEDRCLPQPSRLKDRLEVSLRKNRFAIVEKSFFGNHISISALGYETTSTSCAVSVRAVVDFPMLATVPFSESVRGGNQTVVTYSYELSHFLLTGSKAEMQTRLEKWATDAGDTLFLDISRARDDIFTKFPAIKTSFEGGN